jgi:hypothetical protein
MKIMRIVFSLAFIAVLSFLIWVLGGSLRNSERPGSFIAVKEGDSLSVARLSETERIVIAARPYSHQNVGHLYQIDGGSIRRFGSKDLFSKEVAPSIAGKLTEAECVGLDAFLMFLRHVAVFRSIGGDDIVVGYYRSGRKIGEERFREHLDYLSNCVDEARRFGPERFVGCPEDFPIEVFREIVVPFDIERRIKEPNQSSEPTPTAGTSAAEQPLVPAAVVAHL